MAERFQPPSHVAPDSLIHKALFVSRLVTDLQFKTIYRHMKAFLPNVTGTVVDVGAGQGPYRHLLSEERSQYIGLDIYGSDAFGYNSSEVIHFDGKHIPLDSQSVDSIICTEVLEHVEDPQQLVDEMSRILRPGGRGAITVPWSARNHYVPYDYHRFTPSRLESLFSAFSSVSVEPRGTDISVIVAKVIVVYLRLLRPTRRRWLPVSLLAAVVFAPTIPVCVLVGHAAITLRLGSIDDPLGYTVWIEK